MFSLKYKNNMLGPLADVPPKSSTDIAVIFFSKFGDLLYNLVRYTLPQIKNHLYKAT